VFAADSACGFTLGLWGGGTQAPKSWLAPPPQFSRPPNVAVLLTHRGPLILRKISKFDATKCQILRLKCSQGTRPQIVASAPNLAAPSNSGQAPEFSRTLNTPWSIDSQEISKSDATRRQILRLQCNKIRFPPRLRPRPAAGACCDRTNV